MKKTRQTFSAKQDMIQHCASGRTMVCLNEEELTVTADAAPWDGTEARDPGTVTMYAYDVYWLERKAGGAAISTAADVLEAFKEAKVQELEAFDGSPQVNSFIYAGETIAWTSADDSTPNKSIRMGLRQNIADKMTKGEENITIWLNGKPITLPCAVAEEMMCNLEDYAYECFNVTAQHKANISKLGTVEDVIGYDYTTCYPQKLVF